MRQFIPTYNKSRLKIVQVLKRDFTKTISYKWPRKEIELQILKRDIPQIKSSSAMSSNNVGSYLKATDRHAVNSEEYVNLLIFSISGGNSLDTTPDAATWNNIQSHYIGDQRNVPLPVHIE